jgi:hypothetical protein
MVEEKPAVHNSGLFLFVIPAKAGIQGFYGIACGDARTAMMPLAARRRVTFLCSCKER